jgi:hypothetical protein
MMRQLHLVAVRTLLERRQLDGEVRATLTLAGMRHTSLGYTHGLVVAPVAGVIADRDGLTDSGSRESEGACRTDGGV